MVLYETAFERSVLLLPWFWTWIGVNKIERLTPEGWFEEFRGFKGGKKNDDVIWMHYYSKVFFNAHPPLQ